MTGRKVEEWIGAHPDAAVPDRVKLRIWRREDGICHISKRKIMPGEEWHLEHGVPLHAGGEHREANLFLALVEPHKRKSAEELAVKAKVDRTAKAHVGITRPKQKIKSRGFPPKPEKPNKIDKSALGTLPLPRLMRERT